jgi:hypothetical protein
VPSDNLIRFVMSVSNDPAMADALQDDPDAVLDSWDLTDEEKALVMSGDPARIESALAPGAEGGAPILV